MRRNAKIIARTRNVDMLTLSIWSRLSVPRFVLHVILYTRRA